MTFGEAVKKLNDGWRVARAGWNGNGMWLLLVDEWKVGDHWVDSFETLPFIGVKTADNKFVPWFASQTDILASDWEVVQ